MNGDQEFRETRMVRARDVPFINEAFPAARDAEEIQVAGATDLKGQSLVGIILRPVSEHGSTPLVVMLRPEISRELAEQLVKTADWCDRA